jgi:predicted nucleotidyltransferase
MSEDEPKKKILSYLTDIESLYGVNILFAVESGGREWGFNSKDSDYDVRFVYKRPLSWYLSILNRKDTIDRMFEDGLFDLSGWDIKKMLFQIYKGNPCVAEWFFSNTIYMDKSILSVFSDISKRYFNPRSSIYHYLHMAHGNYKEYILNIDSPILKKYLYICRPLLCCIYIEKYGAQPPSNIDNLIVKVIDLVPIGVVNDIKYIVMLKRNGNELGSDKKIERLNDWISERIKYFQKAARIESKKIADAPDELNDFFMSNVIKDVNFLRREHE